MKIVAYLALLLWLVLGWKYWTDYKTCESLAVGAVDSVADCPICFEWSSPSPHICEDWATFRDSIVSNIPNGYSLLIKTSYNPIESNDRELGRNRAVSIKSLFNELLDENRIILLAEKEDRMKHTNCQLKSTMSYVIDNETIKQHKDAAILHLEDKSIAANPTVRSYLDSLAEKVKVSSEKVMITGHAVSEGSEVENLKQGYIKADQIKAYLLSLGVSVDQIITISKGENEPLNQQINARQEDKDANNRVEIKIINS